MKLKPFLMILLLCMGMLTLSSGLLQAGASSDPNAQLMKSLLDKLQEKIDDADKKMIAHPSFIKDLQKLIDQYRAGFRSVFLHDDFSDGNYTKQPKWVVEKGTFSVTAGGKLLTRMKTKAAPVKQRSSKEKDAFKLILTEILKASDKQGQEKSKAPSAGVPEVASIKTMARIAPAFEIDLSLSSGSLQGTMEVVLLGGKQAVPRYRLIYKSSPSPERPIEIIRERNGRQYIIESAVRYPDLDNGRFHRMQWVRDARGNMKVLVDGKVVLSTVELFYKDEFSGLKLVNRGGTYQWDEVKALQAPPITN